MDDLPRPWVTRTAADEFALELPAGVPEVLDQLRSELYDLLASDDAAVARLFPPAYPDDPEREAGYQALIRGELVERHRAGLDLIAVTAGGATLTTEELDTWMTTVNAIRLVLGTVLGITDDTDPVDLDETNPRFLTNRVYVALSVLLEHIIEALDG